MECKKPNSEPYGIELVMRVPSPPNSKSKLLKVPIDTKKFQFTLKLSSNSKILLVT